MINLFPKVFGSLSSFPGSISSTAIIQSLLRSKLFPFNNRVTYNSDSLVEQSEKKSVTEYFYESKFDTFFSVTFNILSFIEKRVYCHLMYYFIDLMFLKINSRNNRLNVPLKIEVTKMYQTNSRNPQSYRVKFKECIFN